MCGIAGIVGREAGESVVSVRNMIDAMVHRGPDGQGMYCSPSGSAVLGHRRLAILDITEAGAQPMQSVDGSKVLVYNGECYNHRELRTRMPEVPFSSESDTETVLAWLERNGVDGLGSLHAMFGLALWDEGRQSLLLARDRFGIKPLYYTITGDNRVLFASELKALLESGIVERRLNLQALRHYLLYGFVGEPHSIVEQVFMLPPGSWLSWNAVDNSLRTGRFVEEFQEPAGYRLSPEELCAAFVDAVQSHLVSDVPLGAFLSGGVDSSALVGVMASLGAETKTLTVSFPDMPAMSEGEQAAAWAKRCGAHHTDIPMTGEEVLRLLPTVLRFQDQPTLDSVNTFIVSRAARQAGLKVVLSGLGGDELFGGYPVFRDVPRTMRWRSLLGPAAPLMGSCLDMVTSPWPRHTAKLADLLTCQETVNQVYAARRRLFTPRQVNRLLDNGSVGLENFVPEVTNHLSNTADIISLLDLSFYMRHQLLRDSDMMGMACSLEIRVPFLDGTFADYAWNLGERSRDAKGFFITSLRRFLPDDIADRPKRGFTLPFSEWMLGPLKDTITEQFHELPSAIFNKESTGRLWQNFQKNPHAIGWTRPWSLYCLAAFLQNNRITL